MDFDEPLRTEDVVEGQRFPMSYRENADAVHYRVARMWQRGVLVPAKTAEGQIRVDAMIEKGLALMGIQGTFGEITESQSK